MEGDCRTVSQVLPSVLDGKVCMLDETSCTLLLYETIMEFYGFKSYVQTIAEVGSKNLVWFWEDHPKKVDLHSRSLIEIAIWSRFTRNAYQLWCTHLNWLMIYIHDSRQNRCSWPGWKSLYNVLQKWIRLLIQEYIWNLSLNS